MNLAITAYCKINENTCWLNGKEIMHWQDKSISFAKEIYTYLGLQYPKFYKMDLASKYAFLAAEMLLQNNKEIQKYADDEVALLFANATSSTETDLHYLETIMQEKPSPSPSLFVYTLPNIILGEIAIKNKWYGENMFFVFPAFDENFLYTYAKILLSNDTTKAAIIAWVNIENINKIDVFLLSVERNYTDSCAQKLNSETLKDLYQY